MPALYSKRVGNLQFRLLLEPSYSPIYIFNVKLMTCLDGEGKEREWRRSRVELAKNKLILY